MWISNSRLGVSLIPSANCKHSMALRRYSSDAMNLPQVLKDALALATSEMSAPKHPRHLVTNAFPGGTTTPKVGVVLCELHFCDSRAAPAMLCFRRKTKLEACFMLLRVPTRNFAQPIGRPIRG